MAEAATGNVKIAVTLRKEVFDLLQEMCRRDNRSKSREISWIISQSKEAEAAQKENNVIRPHLSVWRSAI